VGEVTNVVRARSEYMVATMEMLKGEFGGVEGIARGVWDLGRVRLRLLEGIS
jgi:hypothetical protein